jgi:hypothetical protein
MITFGIVIGTFLAIPSDKPIQFVISCNETICIYPAFSNLLGIGLDNRTDKNSRR